MTKYHINKHGVPAPCKAKPGNCPLGGNETHFDNIEDAQEYVDKSNENTHGIMPELKTLELSQQEIAELSKSTNENDRIKAIEHGYNHFSILRDPSDKVRMYAAKKGLMSDSLMHDDNKEIAETAKAHYQKTPNGRLDKLHEELVPNVGKADTVAGELVRAATRVNYRYYNDGDRIGVDYGNETCNSSARYLIETLDGSEAGQEISSQLADIWGEDFISDKEYETKLEGIVEDISEYVETNPFLREQGNDNDSRSDYSEPEDYDYYDDDEEDDEPYY